VRTARQQRGDAAESEVADRLGAAGWLVLGRQVRVGRAEIDILAIDPGPPSAVVIVEVRFRADRGYGLPEETVDHRKWARLRGAAYRLRDGGFLPDGTPWPRLPVRFDLVVLEPGATRHHRHAA